MRVYHFLSEQYALDDLRHRRLKASRIEDLNDPFELLGVTLKSAAHRAALRGFKADIDRQWGIMCFSRGWTHPMLWSHYADKHRGICLGFDVPRNGAVPINYKAKRLSFDIERQLSMKTRDEKLGLKLISTKFAGWKYEDEVRLVVQLNDVDPETGFYFYGFGPQLALKRVIVGPRSTCSKSQIVAALSKGDSAANVMKARLAFQTFTVVPQRNQKLWQ